MNSPLGRLRWIGWLEGVSYLVLLFIAMPLKYFADKPEGVHVVGSIHGGLFILFALSVAEVTIRRPWWSPKFWLGSIVASLVPGGTFVLERWLKQLQEADAAQDAVEGQAAALSKGVTSTETNKLLAPPPT